MCEPLPAITVVSTWLNVYSEKMAWALKDDQVHQLCLY